MKTTAHGKTETFLMCIALGVGTALVGWLAHFGYAFCYSELPPSAWLSYFLGGLPLWFLYGGVIGASWAVLAVPSLRRRPLKPASAILGSVLAVVAFTSGFLVATTPMAAASKLYVVGGAATVPGWLGHKKTHR